MAPSKNTYSTGVSKYLRTKEEAEFYEIPQTNLSHWQRVDALQDENSKDFSSVNAMIAQFLNNRTRPCNIESSNFESSDTGWVPFLLKPKEENFMIKNFYKVRCLLLKAFKSIPNFFWNPLTTPNQLGEDELTFNDIITKLENLHIDDK